MKENTLYNMVRNQEVKAYPAGLHDGTVNIPGFTKGTRIISTKVPPMFSPEHDCGEQYTILDWVDDVKNWCMIAEVEPSKMGKLVQMAIDGTAKVLQKYIPDEVIAQGAVQDWRDGNGPLHRTGFEIVLKSALMLFPPNPQVIQLKAIAGWRNFHRRPGENTQNMLARMKIALYTAFYEGNHVVSQQDIAIKLVELFKLNHEQYLDYMKPYGGQLPTTPQGVDLLESQLARDFTILESGQKLSLIHI